MSMPSLFEHVVGIIRTQFFYPENWNSALHARSEIWSHDHVLKMGWVGRYPPLVQVFKAKVKTLNILISRRYRWINGNTHPPVGHSSYFEITWTSIDLSSYFTKCWNTFNVGPHATQQSNCFEYFIIEI